LLLLYEPVTEGHWNDRHHSTEIGNKIFPQTYM
jgi:hypothetical protein